jgi:anthranilate 3-monooxygenase (FAD)/4-hydroxyphenylacetate 3-monooxygenase
MGVRTGKQYVEALQARSKNMCVYLNGRRIEDVTQEPVFQGPIESIAELYDMQHDPAYKNILTYPSPTTGDPVSTAYMIPRSKEDLAKMQRSFKLRADQNFGVFGRAPDFLAAYITGMALNKELYGQIDSRYVDNMQAMYERIREEDLYLTHVLVSPQVDRSKSSGQQADPFLHLGKVKETKEGIVVRGAKMVGTMAPITEMNLVNPFGGIAPGEDMYALLFVVDNDAPGLKYFCRESISPASRSRFDHPLSSRFEEMDCLAVFDDVLIPWENILIDGRPGAGEIVNNSGRGGGPFPGLQGGMRTLSLMEFYTGLAMKLAETSGIDGFLHVQEKLGEMVGFLETQKALAYGSVAMSRPRADGVWLPGPAGGRGATVQVAHNFRRMIEIIQILVGGGFFSVPTEADVESAEIRPYLDKYLQGRGGVEAEERIRLVKLAWDATGEGFAQRLLQYVTFHSGDPIRLLAASYLGFNKKPLFDVVDRALGVGEDQSIPAPEDPFAIPSSARAPGLVADVYPTASIPGASNRK